MILITSIIVYILSIIVYILSIIGCRWIYRLHSSKYYDLWLDQDCKFSILWIIPFVNTFVLIICIIFIISHIYKKNINYPKSKWLNTDL